MIYSKKTASSLSGHVLYHIIVYACVDCGQLVLRMSLYLYINMYISLNTSRLYYSIHFLYCARIHIIIIAEFWVDIPFFVFFFAIRDDAIYPSSRPRIYMNVGSNSNMCAEKKNTLFYWSHNKKEGIHYIYSIVYISFHFCCYFISFKWPMAIRKYYFVLITPLICILPFLFQIGFDFSLCFWWIWHFNLETLYLEWLDSVKLK